MRRWGLGARLLILRPFPSYLSLAVPILSYCNWLGGAWELITHVHLRIYCSHSTLHGIMALLSPSVGGVASSDKLTSLSSVGDYVDTASSTTTVGGCSSYGALESSRTPPPTIITTTQQAPTLTLTELDELWRRFLATSLSSQQPPLRYNQISERREIDHQTTAAATGHLQSTYRRPQVTPALPPSSHTRMQDRYTELLATHGKREGSVSKPARTYIKPSETTQLGFACRHIRPPSNTKGKPLSHSRKVHMQDTSVQTTPSLHVPHPPPRSAISFSIPKQQTPIIEEREELLEQRTVRAAFTITGPSVWSKSEPLSSM